MLSRKILRPEKIYPLLREVALIYGCPEPPAEDLGSLVITMRLNGGGRNAVYGNCVAQDDPRHLPPRLL